MTKTHGFSLIEIMVVIFILGILGTVVLPRVLDRPDQARIVKAKTDISNLEAALDLYKLDHFQYPGSEGLSALVTPPSGEGTAGWKDGGYIKRLPKDPWGREYLYTNPGSKGAVDIYTLGADGASGGTGANADIYNHDL